MSDTPPGGTTPDAMRGAILNIYRATTDVTIRGSRRVLGTVTGSTAECNDSHICTRYVSGDIDIKSTHKAGASGAPDGFGSSFTPLGVLNGIQLGGITATSKTGTDTDVVDVTTTYYGGWLQYSFFAIVLDEFEEGDADQRIVTAFSQGKAATTDPAALDGYDLSWTGKLYGLGHTTASGGGVTLNNRIRGDVKIDITNSMVDVAFSNLVDRNNASNNGRLNDIDDDPMTNDWEWKGLSLDGSGGFSVSDLDGQFYGDKHLEVGGTFDRHGVIGAFGAKRTKRTTQ